MAKTSRRTKQAATTSEPENISSSVSTTTTTTTSTVDSQHQSEERDQRIRNLEQENRAYQKELEELRKKMGSVSVTPDSMQKLKQGYVQKLNALEEQVKDLKKKQDVQSQLSTYRRKNEDGSKHLHDEIQKLKAQKVQLQCKLKLEAVQFRLCKATLDKEILQLKKDGTRKEYEMQKELALNQTQMMALQRKYKQASMALNRLKDLLESRKILINWKARTKKGRVTEMQVQDIDRELEATSHINQICAEYERQIETMTDELTNAKEEAELLKQENFSLLLQSKELDCTEDPDLRDLKEEVTRLTGLLNQLEMSHVKLAPVELLQGELSEEQSLSIGSTSNYTDANASEFETTPEEIIITAAKDTPKTCCSCSKKSLCKTSKCECRASGGSCGTSCGCLSSKCSNRKTLQLPGKENSDPSAIVEPHKSPIPISTLEAAAVVENGHLVPAEADDHCGIKKMPLYDIASTLIKSLAPKQNQRKVVRMKAPSRKASKEAL